MYRLARPVADALARTGPLPRELGRVGDGRYVLVEELGRGTLGRTYRAHDTFTIREVAITLLDLREHGAVARERFRRGADLARRLGHPLLAPSLGTLEDGGRTILVSQFVPGPGLDELLERGPLAPPVAVDLTLGLLDLLHHLHGAGVVRLDLTPSHVVITPDGRPVLVGLGPAHRVDADDAPAGVVVGTPLYLSPEALQGRAVDARSDLFSLGLILVEMLTARPARHGTAATIIARATTCPADVGTLPCSVELRTVIGKVLDPDPDRPLRRPRGARGGAVGGPGANLGALCTREHHMLRRRRSRRYGLGIEPGGVQTQPPGAVRRARVSTSGPSRFGVAYGKRSSAHPRAGLGVLLSQPGGRICPSGCSDNFNCRGIRPIVGDAECSGAPRDHRSRPASRMSCTRLGGGVVLLTQDPARGRKSRLVQLRPILV